MDIKGKTAFVAGGTSGLGLAVARELSARGANLVIVGRRGENEFFNAAVPRLDAGYRIPLSL